MVKYNCMRLTSVNIFLKEKPVLRLTPIQTSFLVLLICFLGVDSREPGSWQQKALSLVWKSRGAR